MENKTINKINESKSWFFKKKITIIHLATPTLNKENIQVISQELKM